MTGKKPVIKEPAVGSPAKKRWRSPGYRFAVGARIAAEDKPDETVKDVMQTRDQEKPVEHTVDEKAHATGPDEGMANPVDARLHHRPDIAAQ